MEQTRKTVLKHEFVSETIREWLKCRKYLPGEHLPTTPELCSMFQLNNRTVASGIKTLIKEGLLESAPRRGTIVKDLPCQPQNNTVLIVTHNFGDVYMESAIMMTSKLLHHELCPVLTDRALMGDTEKMISFLRCFTANQRPHGIVVEGGVRFPYKYIQEHSDQMQNVIFVSRYHYPEQIKGKYVLIDLPAAARLIVEYFAEKNVKTILFPAIYEHTFRGDWSSMQMMLKKNMETEGKKLGISIDNTLFEETFFGKHFHQESFKLMEDPICHGPLCRSGWRQVSFEEALERAGDHAGIFCYQDSWIPDIVNVFLERIGRKDIPVLGGYNTHYAKIGKFASLDFQIGKIMETACDMLIGNIHENYITIPPIVVDHSKERR